MGACGRFCLWLVDLIQPHQMSIFDIFRLYGSVLPRTIIYGVIGALEGGLMKHYNIELVQNRQIWQHPYALHVSPPPSPRRPDATALVATRAAADGSSRRALPTRPLGTLTRVAPPRSQIYGMVLGFTLVMRLQIAYQRLWEGATQCHQASSKWADAVMQIVAFDEASKDAFTEAAFEFRMLMIHYSSLMNACALIDMRSDETIMPVRRAQ